jgi:amidase
MVPSTMNVEEYNQYDAIGLAALIRGGEVSASEVVEVAIKQIARLNPKLNAVIATDFEAARESIRTGDTFRPLYGVSYLVKDLNTWVSGLPATNGSRAFADFVPPRDGELVRRMRAAGLIILGKTNTPEFGLNMCTAPQLFGATCNPFNPELSAGGSGGGSACAVAAGI